MKNNKELDNLKEIVITKEDGTKELCMVAFTYDSPEYKKKYVAYTNGKFDKDYKLQMYASILEGTLDNPIVKPIEDEKEQYMIYDILIDFENKINDSLKDEKN